MRIALTYTGSDVKHGYYKQWLQGGNEDIDVIKISEAEKNAAAVHDCDGLVLSGGIDVNPALYNGGNNYPNSPGQWNDMRDIIEGEAFKIALGKNIPVLGICRGLQLINVLLNGTLVQDLGEKNTTHEGGPDKLHAVQLQHNSLLHEITGIISAEVNSAHHQAIGKLGYGLQVNCAAADGTIEGVEWADRSRKPFLLGIQWHAERMFLFNLQNSPLSEGVRNKFIQEIRNAKQ